MNVSRVPVVGGIAASSLLLLAAPAFAHVSVQPVGEAAQGGYATVNVKVPNERDNASTTRLEVTFPVDEHPLASVMPQPVPGWTAKVTRTKLDKPLELHGEKITEAVSKVTWTGGKIGPGEFQQFPLSLGQLPETDRLVLKAIQTYSNKEVVRWIEEPTDGGEEPESPAPVLELSAASEDGHHGTDEPKADDAKSEAKAEDTHEETASSDDGGSDTTARVLAVVGILIGAAGVAFGVLAGRRRTTG